MQLLTVLQLRQRKARHTAISIFSTKQTDWGGSRARNSRAFSGTPQVNKAPFGHLTLTKQLRIAELTIEQCGFQVLQISEGGHSAKLAG